MFIVLEVILWPVAGLGSPWEPVRMIAAILPGPGVLPPPASFDAWILVAAMIVHFSLSIVYAVVYATFRQLMLKGRLRRLASLSHGLFGLFIYLINFYGFTTLFPWFIEARHGISILVHVAWGVTIPWAYDARAEQLEARDEVTPDSARA